MHLIAKYALTCLMFRVKYICKAMYDPSLDSRISDNRIHRQLSTWILSLLREIYNTSHYFPRSFWWIQRLKSIIQYAIGQHTSAQFASEIFESYEFQKHLFSVCARMLEQDADAPSIVFAQPLLIYLFDCRFRRMFNNAPETSNN